MKQQLSMCGSLALLLRACNENMNPTFSGFDVAATLPRLLLRRYTYYSSIVRIWQSTRIYIWDLILLKSIPCGVSINAQKCGESSYAVLRSFPWLIRVRCMDKYAAVCVLLMNCCWQVFCCRPLWCRNWNWRKTINHRICNGCCCCCCCSCDIRYASPCSSIDLELDKSAFRRYSNGSWFSLLVLKGLNLLNEGRSERARCKNFLLLAQKSGTCLDLLSKLYTWYETRKCHTNAAIKRKISRACVSNLDLDSVGWLGKEHSGVDLWTWETPRKVEAAPKCDFKDVC